MNAAVVHGPRQRRWLDNDLQRLAAWLPRLGPTLWLQRTPPATRARACMTSAGVVLFEHNALTALGECTQTTVQSAVTAHGPREWLTFRDAHDEARIKLFLLPDTGYLEWDEMLASCALPCESSTTRWHTSLQGWRFVFERCSSPWQARVVRFGARRLPYLLTLGLRSPGVLSGVGRELADTIVGDAHAQWATTTLQA